MCPKCEIHVRKTHTASSRRSEDEGIQARDRSHSRGRDFRDGETSRDYLQYEHENIDTYTSHSTHEDKRRNK